MYVSPRRTSALPLLISLLVIAVIVFGAFQLLRGLPAYQTAATLEPTSVLGTAAALPMPQSGAAIVAVDGLGTLASAGATTPRPIASVAKVMTAYLILQHHPLKPGETGPTVTITAADVTRYLQAIAQDQSTLPVIAGMQLTELELLQGLLIPSANNFAEILAAWDSGSVASFVTAMNGTARTLGMTSTIYADTSGFSAGSTSTGQDQLLLARAAMQDPVFKAIVGSPTALIRGIGTVSNVNELLGRDGVIGIKTGMTDEAGGSLLFAAVDNVGGQQALVLGAVFGQLDHQHAFDATHLILAAVAQGLKPAKVVSAGDVVATAKPPWGHAIDIVAANDLQLLLWPGMTLTTSVQLDDLKAPLAADTQVGSLEVKLGDQQQSVPLRLAKPLTKPGLFWRLTRSPF